MVKKIKERTEALVVGDPSGNIYAGPVINDRAKQKILEYIEIGKKEGKLLTGGGTVGKDGYYIKPTVIADIKPMARLSQEEVFGPVLALIPVETFDEALSVANNTEYGLTGAVYAKNRSKLDKAARDFFVGNLYLNRKCTGALVGVHPFGGFNMSGTDSKAGGHDYLQLFMQARSVAEKIVEPVKRKSAKKKPARKTTAKKK